MNGKERKGKKRKEKERKGKKRKEKEGIEKQTPTVLVRVQPSLRIEYSMYVEYVGNRAGGNFIRRRNLLGAKGGLSISNGCSGEMMGSMLIYVCGSHGINTPWPIENHLIWNRND